MQGTRGRLPLFKTSNIDSMDFVERVSSAFVTVSALGALLNIYTGLGGFLSVIGFLVSVPWLLSVPPTPATLRKRLLLLGSAALSQGMLLGPLVGTALQLHPGTLVTALAGTSLVFLCFSGAALLSKRRSYLYLGGLLSSVVSLLMLMRFATWFLGGRALLFEAELYVGLAVFCGYLLVDTQARCWAQGSMVVERAEADPARADHVRAALDLFIDFAALFTRILIILLRNAEQRAQREREQQQRGGKRHRRY
ncbi:hypothetical protein N2152v2_003057 [Parachlorella kessleri]